MTITATVTQVSNSFLEVQWSDTESPPTAGYGVTLTVNAGTPKQRALVAGDISVFADQVDDLALAVGDTVLYGVTNEDSFVGGQTQLLVWRDLEAPFTYGPVNALAETIRYTSLEEVKTRLGIPLSDTAADALVTQSAIAAEVQIDQIDGRSFPDTGANPEWPGIPQPIRAWATDAAIAVYKRADAPFGKAGSDNWIGTLDVADEVERALRRNPLALGYKISFGIGFQANRAVV